MTTYTRLWMHLSMSSSGRRVDVMSRPQCAAFVWDGLDPETEIDTIYTIDTIYLVLYLPV